MAADGGGEEAGLAPGSQRQGFPWGRTAAVLALLLVLAILFSYGVQLVAAASWAVPYRSGLRLAAGAVWLLLGVVLVGRGRALVSRLVRGRERGVFWNALVNIFSAVAYLLVLFEAFSLWRVNPSNLLVGGAVTGVVVGLAAQTTLGNLFAGLVILALRPYAVGQWITCRSWMFGGSEYAGRVEEVNLFYTVLEEDGTRRVIPNAAAVIAAVTHERTDKQRFELELPYAVGLEEFREALRREGAEAEVRISGFGADGYRVRVTLPMDTSPELIRRARWRLGAAG